MPGLRITPSPSTAPSPDPRALGDHHRLPIMASSLDDHRRGLRRLEHAADADAAGEVHVGADLGARPDRRPRVDHRAAADAGADVDVARHEDDARSRNAPRRADAPGTTRTPAAREARLQRELVGVLERADLDGLHAADSGTAAGSPSSATRGRRPRRRRARRPAPRPGRAARSRCPPPPEHRDCPRARRAGPTAPRFAPGDRPSTARLLAAFIGTSTHN